ncbi:MAG: MoaD/ThiS family protein [Proteobacteria bacterium]|nr:MoaD/ThiS family protein [Pseudomonadota bacterium]
MVKVKFFTLLRLYLEREDIDIDIGANEVDVKTLLHKVNDALGNDIILDKLLESNGKMKTGTIVLVNGGDVMDTDKLDSVVKDGDSISLFPPGGGG